MSGSWHVYAVDVGSRRASFGWVGPPPGDEEHFCKTSSGSEARSAPLETFLARITDDLKAGRAVALGLEAPLFLPIQNLGGDDGSPSADADLWRRYPVDLTMRKGGDGVVWAPWFAQGGASSLASAQMLLHHVMKRVPDDIRVTTSPSIDGRSNHPALWIWEAFVSGLAKTEAGCPVNIKSQHTADACLAARCLRYWLKTRDSGGSPWGAVLNKDRVRVTRESASDLTKVDGPKDAQLHGPDGWLNIVEVTVRAGGRHRVRSGDFEDFVIVKALADEERKLLRVANWPTP